MVVTVVSKSSTSWLIATFITAWSSTIRNCASDRTMRGRHFFMVRRSYPRVAGSQEGPADRQRQMRAELAIVGWRHLESGDGRGATGRRSPGATGPKPRPRSSTRCSSLIQDGKCRRRSTMSPLAPACRSPRCFATSMGWPTFSTTRSSRSRRGSPTSSSSRTPIDPGRSGSDPTCRARVALYDAAGSLMRVGRARALDHEPMVARDRQHPGPARRRRPPGGSQRS